VQHGLERLENLTFPSLRLYQFFLTGSSSSTMKLLSAKNQALL
jgi:hypothetical protein